MNLRTQLVLAVGGVLAAGAAGAQTVTQPDGAWRGSIGAAATATSGGTKTTNASFNADMVRQTTVDKLGFYWQNVYGKGRFDGVDRTTAQIVRFGGRYDRDISGRLFAFGGMDVDKNKLGDVRWRYSPAAGVGLHVIRDDRNTWDAFVGVGHTRTDFYRATDRSENNLVLGEESTHKLTPTTSFRQRVVLYPSLKDTGEYRAIAEAGLTTALFGAFNLVVNASARYDSQAPSGVKKTDTLFFTGIQYAFGPPLKK